ncbi:DUF6361 family protein [Dactylosporangium sp. CA-233914]|uniref:DUF6361 family protein n=1 Tax=Dactylosporangium sp. CA-233914 TaxID=3239934 RepID=UPI003D8E9908
MTYRGVSTIGWLDTDDQQTRQVRAAIAGLDDKEALDPLGLGGIRDAFAERLFPGTSTIQTRLRYFLFVPWILQDLEVARPDRRRFEHQLRSRELRLIESLRNSEGRGVGVIGYRARQRVSRLPSSIYWYGLGSWGIRRDARLSLSQYRDALTRRGTVSARDRDPELAVAPQLMWDPGLPDAPPGFPDEGVDLQVTRKEAQYLQDRMAQTRLDLTGGEEQPSLLAIIALDPDRWLQAWAPWEGPILGLPQSVGDLLRHGQLFSLVTFGAQLLYNVLLCAEAERRCGVDSDDLATWLHDQLADWVTAMTASKGELADWWSQPNEFWDVVPMAGARVRPVTQRFLHQWITSAIRSPRDATTNRSLAAALVAQEQSLKGRYARLSDMSALQSWRGEPLGAARQTYRWPTVRRLLADLRDGLA